MKVFSIIVTNGKIGKFFGRNTTNFVLNLEGQDDLCSDELTLMIQSDSFRGHALQKIFFQDKTKIIQKPQGEI